MYDTHQKFIDWSSRYDVGDVEGKTLARHLAYLKDQHCPLLEFRGELAVSDITAKVLRSLRGTGSAA